MRKESLEFLRSLTDTPGPSGYEQTVRAVFLHYVEQYADEVRTDVLGNAIAVRNPSGRPRILLAGHIDEIGFQIRSVSDEGMLYFGTIGGHDPSVAAGQRVVIHTANGPVPGVLGRKAVHILEPEERDKVPKIKDMWIDIGAKSKEDALARVQIGDSATYDTRFLQLTDDLCMARSFDDKVGAFAVAEVLRLLHGSNIEAAIYAVATVQEEIGLRGATTSTFAVNPDVGIAVDVGHSTDYPGSDKRVGGDVKLGGGPMIARGAHVHPKVFERLREAAVERGIPYVVEAVSAGTGTDADAIQLSRAGVAAGVVSIPLRYMHTPSEILSLTDVENTALLLAAFCEKASAMEEWLLL